MIRQSIYTIVAGFVKTYLRHSFGVSTFSLSSIISFLRLVKRTIKPTRPMTISATLMKVS